MNPSVVVIDRDVDNVNVSTCCKVCCLLSIHDLLGIFSFACAEGRGKRGIRHHCFQALVIIEWYCRISCLSVIDQGICL